MKLILKNKDDGVVEEVEIPDDLKSLEVVKLKELLSGITGDKIDTLFIYKHESIVQDNVNLDKTDFSIYHYKVIRNKTVRVTIDYYQNDIDKVFIDICSQSSIYMLKYIIWKRLGIDIKQQGLLNLTTQKQLKDDSLLSDISNELGQQVGLIFQLFIRTPSKLTMGLDFGSFTMLKNINKLDFDKEAPRYREVSDGLSLFCTCQNVKCKIKSDLFIKNLGYGRFNIMDEIHHVKCPLCLNESIEVKNVGFVKCEWVYAGTLLKGNKSSNLNGDGMTVDNKLYVLNETDLSKHFEYLDITVKESRVRYKVYANEEGLQSQDFNVFGDLQLNDPEEDDCREFVPGVRDKREENFRKSCIYSNEFKKGTISNIKHADDEGERVYINCSIF
jgi:hypothetical protein